jgi:glycolate oxidase FAD binding subunit
VNVASAPGRDFLALSRRLLDALGAEGLGSESDQRQFAVDGIEPAWVLLPASAPETGQALALCAAHDLAVVPAGLGLRLAQGRPPTRLDAVLSTSRMDHIVEHAADDLTVTVEAGATLASVNATLRASGQWLPLDPALPAETTIGGLLAANVAGPSRQAFGTVREWLLGLRVALPDGTIAKSGGRVVKNVAGYDVHKLLVGSFGTLAVILEATFKLQPLPEAIRVLAFSSPDMDVLFRLGSALADSASPPRFVEVVVEGDGPPRLITGFAGLVEEVEDGLSGAAAMAAGLGVDPEREPAGDEELHNLLDAFERARDGVAVVLRARTRREDARGWLASALSGARSMARSVAAHAHAGIGVAHLRLDEPDPERLTGLVAALRQAAARGGGYLVVEAAPTGWKNALDVWGPPRPGFALMRSVKAAFDPRGLLAPGRFVGGI